MIYLPDPGVCHHQRTPICLLTPLRLCNCRVVYHTCCCRNWNNKDTEGNECLAARKNHPAGVLTKALPCANQKDSAEIPQEFTAYAYHLGYKTVEDRQELWKKHCSSTQRVALIHFDLSDINFTAKIGTRWKGKLQSGVTRWSYNTGRIRDGKRDLCPPCLRAPPRPAKTLCGGIDSVQQDILNMSGSFTSPTRGTGRAGGSGSGSTKRRSSCSTGSCSSSSCSASTTSSASPFRSPLGKFTGGSSNSNSAKKPRLHSQSQLLSASTGGRKRKRSASGSSSIVKKTLISELGETDSLNSSDVSGHFVTSFAHVHILCTVIQEHYDFCGVPLTWDSSRQKKKGMGGCAELKCAQLSRGGTCKYKKLENGRYKWHSDTLVTLKSRIKSSTTRTD